ncbi:hypothetical protein PCASD_11966 [Puccinia coronata f. sp. avenae]|uniref:Uncharacterized protein n=1 Tax=Puccinia coronata f. sp. avenae TaxID=200324 RepID=A0A2N5UWH5_9BASI|nr:hypothetical protein PCASD_11966 [Puccinia coronata f. sp. avenae]
MARTFLLSNSAPSKEKPNDASNSSAPQGSSPEIALSSLSAPVTTSVPTNTLLALATQQAMSTPLSSVGQSRAVDHFDPSGDQRPVSYTFSPAALERLRRSREQHAHGARRDRPARTGAGVSPRPGNSTLGSLLPSDLHSPRLLQIDACPPPSGETDVLSLSREAPPPLTAGSTTPTATRLSAPTNVQPRGREMSIDPSPLNQIALRGQEMSVDTNIPAQDELTTISNIFQGQWLLFVNAKESNNYRLMRIALNQAISTQDTLTTLFGTQRMLEVSDGWLARDKLARMERMFHIPPQPLPQAIMEQPATRAPPQQVAAVMEQTHSTPLPRPFHPEHLAPQNSARQPLHQRPPPPPPPPPPAPHTQEAQAQTANQLMAPPLVPVQTPPNIELQPGTHQPEAQRAYPPLQYQGQEAYYDQDEYYYLPQHPPHAYNPYARPYSNGDQLHPPYPRGRRRADPMTGMLQVGSFFMRAERMINRSQRRQDRGRMAPPAYLPPNNPQ